MANKLDFEKHKLTDEHGNWWVSAQLFPPQLPYYFDPTNDSTDGEKRPNRSGWSILVQVNMITIANNLFWMKYGTEVFSFEKVHESHLKSS